MSGVIINDDADGFLKDPLPAVAGALPIQCAPVPQDNADYLVAEADFLGAPGVTAVFFNLNMMRPRFEGGSSTPFWDGLEQNADGQWCFEGKILPDDHLKSRDNLIVRAMRYKALTENCPDIIAPRRDVLSKRGISTWASMRMNDVHHVSYPSHVFFHDAIWRNNPDYRRATFKGDTSFWFSQCLDYAIPHVYEHQMAIAKDMLEKYDLDGLELDWMRSPFFFRPGAAEANMPILTRFMREVRQEARRAEQRLGHPVRIAVRCHAHPEDDWEAGMDTPGWASKGLCDIVVPSPYFHSAEGALPIQLWKKLLPENVLIAPCVDRFVSSGHYWMANTPEIDAGFASQYYYRGADAIYLFNHMVRDTPFHDQDLLRQRDIYTALAQPETSYAMSRRHILTCREVFTDGIRPESRIPMNYPPDMALPLQIDLGGKTRNRKAFVVLLQEAKETPPQVFLNGMQCTHDDKQTPPAFDDETFMPLVYAVPENVIHDGWNQVDLIPGKNGIAINAKWCEIWLP